MPSLLIRCVIVLSVWTTTSSLQAALLRGKIVDDADGSLVPARMYIQSDTGTWYHAQSSLAKGSAVKYEIIRGPSQEVHTTLSAHPFQADLPPGRYTLTVERGKEYHTLNRKIDIKNQPVEVELRLDRWINMAQRGWYSGDTHVHRTMADLPNVILAEDLNVALPLTYWVTDSTETPAEHNRNREIIPPPKLIRLDHTHVIWPINTEYEIFSVRRKRHTLGAIFVLNHTKPLELTAPTVGPMVEAARAQNNDVVLDLDKHNWPWSMMLPPVARVDLFELTNNHIWRTIFQYTNWYPEYAATYMNLKMDADGNFTERGWIDFGFKTYYALLNCGIKMQPTGGTASGVHPVPLGFGRVYVQLDDGLIYDQWIRGLKNGRSFVTTGPMLTATIDGKPHGSTFTDFKPGKIHIVASGESVHPLKSVEIIVNGKVAKKIKPGNQTSKQGTYRSLIDTKILIEKTSWVALRCFEDRPDQRPRFAHTSPFHLEIANRPLQPHEEELEYLIRRVEEELKRHQDVLSEESFSEFEDALRTYKNIDVLAD